MMHDVAKLVLLVGFAKEFEQACTTSRKESIRLHTAIQKILGVSDAAIGAYLLATWGFPESIVDAVNLHYQPSQRSNSWPCATTAVHLAYASEHDQLFPPADPDQSAFDLAYTDTLGITNQLGQFRNLTAESVVQIGQPSHVAIIG